MRNFRIVSTVICAFVKGHLRYSGRQKSKTKNVVFNVCPLLYLQFVPSEIHRSWNHGRLSSWWEGSWTPCHKYVGITLPNCYAFYNSTVRCTRVSTLWYITQWSINNILAWSIVTHGFGGSQTYHSLGNATSINSIYFSLIDAVLPKVGDLTQRIHKNFIYV